MATATRTEIEGAGRIDEEAGDEGSVGVAEGVVFDLHVHVHGRPVDGDFFGIVVGAAESDFPKFLVATGVVGLLSVGVEVEIQTAAELLAIGSVGAEPRGTDDLGEEAVVGGVAKATGSVVAESFSPVGSVDLAGGEVDRGQGAQTASACAGWTGARVSIFMPMSGRCW